MFNWLLRLVLKMPGNQRAVSRTYTTAEDTLILHSKKSTPELARMLNRTESAIYKRRRRIKDKEVSG